jgi:N6-adenosine-specific RNA methylase IME4
MSQVNGGNSVRHQPIIIPDFEAIASDWRRIRPAGGFRVGYVDCPWLFKNRSPKGMQKNAAMHYPCIATSDLMKLPVNELFAKDAAIFFWAIWPLMPDAFEVLKAWGFDYAGLAFEWIKFNPETGKYAFGPGYGTRKNLEPCLLATRGNPSLKQDCPLFETFSAGSAARSVRDFIEWWPLDAVRSRRREHSRKPPEARDRILQLFDGPYIELFAREAVAPFAAWGNQLDKFAVAA